MKILNFLLVLSTILVSQNIDSPLSDEPKKNNSDEKVFIVSCEHPIVNKAKKEGLSSLTWKETPFFMVMSFRGKRQARKAGVNYSIGKLFQEKQAKQHEEAKMISGPGSCCITVTGLIIIYSFLGLALGGAK